MEMTHANTANRPPVEARLVVIATSCSPSPAYPAQGPQTSRASGFRAFAGTFVSPYLWITLKKCVGAVDFPGRAQKFGPPTRFASI
jgi:hypothetical protein